MLEIFENNLIKMLDGRIDRAAQSNYKKEVYYYQEVKTKDLGINTPERLQCLSTVFGWGTMAVDVLMEKQSFRGFYNPNTDNEDLAEETAWLNKQLSRNNFQSKQKWSIKDSLITGAGFNSIAPGDPSKGEPEILIIPENSKTITVDVDQRTGRVTSAFKRIKGNKNVPIRGILWTPNSTIQVVKNGKEWVELERDDHNIGVVGVQPVFNNPDSNYPCGRTEISKSLRGFIDLAMRTILGVEVSREYYSKPLRFLVNLSEDAFTKFMEKQRLPQISSEAGVINAIPGGSADAEGGSAPADIKEFSANDPSQIMNMLEPIARFAAREMNVPPSYLGFDSVNPTSADAINAGESSLTRRANDRNAQLEIVYKDMAFLMSTIAGRAIPKDFDEISGEFESTEVKSEAAAADWLSKLNAAGMFSLDLPDFIYKRLGLTRAEIVELKAYNERNRANSLTQALVANRRPKEVTPTDG
jgi:hypothetical protein